MARLDQRERLEFLQSFERLLGNWNLEEGRVKALSSDYETVWNQVGAGRFRSAVEKVIHESGLRFFPSIGEFRGYIPQAAKIVYCGEAGCTDGLRQVPDYEARRLYNNDSAMAYRRCGCARLS